MIEAMLQSALRSAELAEATGLRHDRIIISAKVCGVRDLVDVYRLLATRCDYPLHLGLTEAGMGMKGIVASTAGLSILLDEGIGDTIRVSLTPEPGGDRTEEVRVAQQVLQSLGLRSFLPQVIGLPRLRPHDQHVLPGDGGADPGLPADQMPVWRETLSRASRRCASRSWAASSTGPASRSTPTSASRCRARSRSRSRPSSWTARSTDAPRRGPRRRVHRHPRGLRRRPVPDPCADPLSPPVSEAARRRDRAWPWLAPRPDRAGRGGPPRDPAAAVRRTLLRHRIRRRRLPLRAPRSSSAAICPYTEFTLLHPPGHRGRSWRRSER